MPQWEEFQCTGCSQVVRRKKKSKKRKYPTLCRSCANVEMMKGRDYSGPNSPTWKGGHRYWQAGKLGRDKDGLSWKAQRQLAWERDDYICQDCHKTREELGQNPDVDHVVPYRISFSHALENLLCRCRSCHKKAEATRTELWGGKSFGGAHLGQTLRPRCSTCGKKRKLKDNLCEPCVSAKSQAEAQRLRIEGKTYQQIMEILGVSMGTAHRWVNTPILVT